MEALYSGPAPVISDICRSVGIDQLVEWDARQCKLSPGVLVEAIIISVLGDHKPLYRMA